MGLGSYLKAVRESRGVTLRQVEEITAGKVSNAYLSQVETGRRKGSFVILHRLAAAYAISLDDIAKHLGEDTPPPALAVCPSCGQFIRSGTTHGGGNG